MNEVNETAPAAAETEQASNMSPSEFINRRVNQINSDVEEAQEQTEVEESEESYDQETEVSDEEVAEEVETEEEESDEVEGDSDEDVLSQIELDDMTDDELRELSDKLGSRAVARFGELTAKRKAAEAEVERLRSEMGNKLQSNVKESDNPYNNIDSIEKLQSVQQEVENVVEWAEDLIFNSDGYGPDDVITEVEGKELTKSEVRKHLQSARKAEKKYIPAQLKTIEKREANIAATLLKVQERKTAKGNSYAIMKLTDLTSVFEIFIFSDMLELNREILKEGNSLILTLVKSVSNDENRFKRINVQKIASLKDLFNSPINEVSFDVKCDDEVNEILKLLKQEGKTKININMINDDKIFKFKLKNTRDLDRKSLNLIRKKDISCTVA